MSADLLDPRNQDYRDFLASKICRAASFGFDVPLEAINPALKPHVRIGVQWDLRGGRRANFWSFGLHKTSAQLEIMRLLGIYRPGPWRLIVLPLGVRQEFFREARERFTGEYSIEVRFVRTNAEMDDPGVIYLTNYESIREGKLDPSGMNVSLDEAAVLRGFGGSKTFREFMRHFEGAGGFRFVNTATPSPNDYIEILAYAAFLGIMDIGQAKTRFFKRDSEKADQLTLHPHKEREFWLWVASWALFITKPSDLDPSFSDVGYELPPLDIRWHELPTDDVDVPAEVDGQARMFKSDAIGVVAAAREKRSSLAARIAKVREIVQDSPEDHFILWHDLEDERRAIEASIPGVASVYGTQDLEDREQIVADFSDGRIKDLAAKPVMLGSGTNLQRHCHRSVYAGIGFKLADFVQSIHRILRFGQTHECRIDLVYTQAERGVRRELERKWEQHKVMVQNMVEIIRQYGLNQTDALQQLTRALGVERVEVVGERYRLVNNDCVLEARRLADNSVGLIETSIPFSTQYEYSPNYADFGHSDDNAHFFQQMEYLIPELLRALQPGRLAVIHVKDRIVPMGMTRNGCQTAYRFHSDVAEAFTTCPPCRAERVIAMTTPGSADVFCRHRFAYAGMKTIVTDVVRENAQTYRLGWTEQCKDATKMGVGMPEYLLLFRKPPTDPARLASDTPVVKSKPDCIAEDGNVIPFDRDRPIKPGKGYSRSRWQVDAHGFTRSNGDRPLAPEDLQGLNHAQIFRAFRKYSMEQVYDFEHHVRLGEALEGKMRLPTDFMLLQPTSWSDDVWTNVTRMRTLNGAQYAKGRELHICPMQFDIADRVIAQMSNPGDLVFDPFSGLGTVPLRAIKVGRRGLGVELSGPYFLDSCAYLKAEEERLSMPTLYDLLDSLEAEDADVPEEIASAGER